MAGDQLGHNRQGHIDTSTDVGRRTFRNTATNHADSAAILDNRLHWKDICCQKASTVHQKGLARGDRIILVKPCGDLEVTPTRNPSKIRNEGKGKEERLGIV